MTKRKMREMVRSRYDDSATPIAKSFGAMMTAMAVGTKERMGARRVPSFSVPAKRVSKVLADIAKRRSWAAAR